MSDTILRGAGGALTSPRPDLDRKPHAFGAIAFILVLAGGLGYAAFSIAQDMRSVGEHGLATGALVMLGLPMDNLEFNAANVILGRKSVTGSNIGGIRETQEMIDFCAEHDVTAEIELINADTINEAYDRVVGSDVKYRFVIDAKTF